MFEKEEHALEQLKKILDEQPIPSTIDQYITAGLAMGKKKKQRTKRQLMMSLAASFVIMAMVFTIRVSPAFAAYVSQIPGLDFIVELIHYDKGLRLAVENDFIQPIGRSDEHENIKITVDSIIVDESRMILFYTIENKSEHDLLDIADIDFVIPQEDHWPVSFGYSAPGEEGLKKKIIHNTIDIQFIKETKIPDILTLKIKLTNTLSYEENQPQTTLTPTWSIDIPIDKAAFANMKEEYLLNQTVDIEGQKVHFNKVTIFPTRIALEVKYDEGNSKKIFEFDDLRLVDEKGEEFASVNNGISASFIDDYTRILYLQSNYFKHPKELYLKASRLKALDKDKLEVIVELEKKQLLKKPDDRLELEEINKNSEQIELLFAIKNELPYDENRGYGLFYHQFSDSQGDIYEFVESGFSTGGSDPEYSESRYTIKNINYTNPIILTIDYYPTRIYGDIYIKIK